MTTVGRQTILTALSPEDMDEIRKFVREECVSRLRSWNEHYERLFSSVEKSAKSLNAKHNKLSEEIENQKQEFSEVVKIAESINTRLNKLFEDIKYMRNEQIGSNTKNLVALWKE